MGIFPRPTYTLTSVVFPRSESVLSRLSASPSASFTRIQESIDQLTDGFVAQATDLKMLISLTAGGFAYRFAKLGVTKLVVGAYGYTPLRTASIVVGLGSEVGVFEFSNRALLSLQVRAGLKPVPTPNIWSWSGPGGLRDGLATSFFTFGILRGAGFLAREENLIFQHAFQSTAMVAGQHATARLGVVPDPQGTLAEQFLHAEATNLQMGAAMGLLHRLVPGLETWEKRMDLHLLKVKATHASHLQGSLPWAFAETGFGKSGAPEDFTKSPEQIFGLSLMSSQKGGGSSPDLPAMVRDAIKNKPKALESLMKLAERGHPWALNALREVAEKNLKGIFALIELDKKGVEGAGLKLKHIDVSRFRRGDPNRGAKGEALRALAEAQNTKAIDLFLQDIKKDRQSSSLSLIVSLARKQNPQAFTALGEIAPFNAQAVSWLYSLWGEGFKNAGPILRGVDTKNYSTLLLALEKEEILIPISYLARAGNKGAFEILSRAARVQPKAIDHLLSMAKDHHPEAVASLAEAAQWGDKKILSLALKALRTLATSGFQEAAQELTRFPKLPVKAPKPKSVWQRIKTVLSWLRKQ